MFETTNKYKLPVHFSITKLAGYLFATINFSNVQYVSSNLPPFTLIYLQSWSKNANKRKMFLKTA